MGHEEVSQMEAVSQMKSVKMLGHAWSNGQTGQMLGWSIGHQGSPARLRPSPLLSADAAARAPILACCHASGGPCICLQQWPVVNRCLTSDQPRFDQWSNNLLFDKWPLGAGALPYGPWVGFFINARTVFDQCLFYHCLTSV